MTERPADPGLGNERTALAWQRTALSVLAGSAVLARLTAPGLGWFSLLAVAVAVPTTAWIMVEARGRYRHDSAQVLRGRDRDGRASAALATAVSCACVTELLALLVRPTLP